MAKGGCDAGEERVQKTETEKTGQCEEVEEKRMEGGTQGYTGAREESPVTDVACCLAASPICLLSHHLRQPQRASEGDEGRGIEYANVPHVDTAPRYVTLTAYHCMRGAHT